MNSGVVAYNINEFSAIQLGIFELVKCSLGSNVLISGIRHEQYKEVYQLKYRDCISNIGIFYKKNNKITSIAIQGDKHNPEFDDRLLDYLTKKLSNLHVFTAEPELDLKVISESAPPGIYEKFASASENLQRAHGIKSKLVKIDPRQQYLIMIFAIDIFSFVECMCYYKKEGFLSDCKIENRERCPDLCRIVEEELAK